VASSFVVGLGRAVARRVAAGVQDFGRDGKPIRLGTLAVALVGPLGLVLNKLGRAAAAERYAARLKELGRGLEPLWAAGGAKHDFDLDQPARDEQGGAGHDFDLDQPARDEQGGG